jgi:hypothetical protein
MDSLHSDELVIDDMIEEINGVSLTFKDKLI